MSLDQEETRTTLGFAPNDPTDGRKTGEWESRYKGSDAIKHIRIETCWLVSIFFLCAVAIFLIWLELPLEWFHISGVQYTQFRIFLYGAFGGLLGGTLYSLKWLYHSVARGIWNLDRRLWRFLTPIISAGLAFAAIVLIRSGLFTPFNRDALESGTLCFSVGFLVGYFSDTAAAKMAEIAQTMFGVTSHETKRPSLRA